MYLSKYEGDLFYRWKNDLIVTSLKNRSIYKIKIDENYNIKHVERINLNHRLRDHFINEKGEIIFFTDDTYLLKLNLDKENDWIKISEN